MKCKNLLLIVLVILFSSSYCNSATDEIQEAYNKALDDLMALSTIPDSSKLENLHDDITDMGISFGYVLDCLMKFDKINSDSAKNLYFAVGCEASYVFKTKYDAKSFDFSVAKTGENLSKKVNDINICKKRIQMLIQLGEKYEIYTTNHFKPYLNNLENK